MAGRVRKAATAQAVTFVGAALLRYLQDEDFRRRVTEVSTGVTSGVRSWAARRRHQPALPSAAQHAGMRARFGQGALERRIQALRTMAAELSRTHPEFAAHVASTADDLQRAVTVASNMPPATKWRTRRSIDARLDEIEKALVDAVLPPAPR